MPPTDTERNTSTFGFLTLDFISNTGERRVYIGCAFLRACELPLLHWKSAECTKIRFALVFDQLEAFLTA